MSPPSSPGSRLRPSDLALGSLTALRARPGRVALSGLGVALGVATLVATLGLSASSTARIRADLEALGTGLLRVTPGSTLGGEEAELPENSELSVERLPGVMRAAAVGDTDATVRRSDLVPELRTGGLSVLAVTPGLTDAVSVPVALGRGVDETPADLPGVVLGAGAAARLGIGPTALAAGVSVHVAGDGGEADVPVVGVLAPAVLAPEIDRAVLLNWSAAESLLGFDGHPTTVYEVSTEQTVASVRDRLPGTVDPQHPEQVEVSRPSDALAARAVTDRTLTSLLAGLAAVCLLVGGVGVANTMVIAVLERRGEIGLRRALGARRRHVLAHVLSESAVVGLAGGVAGVVAGVAVTAGAAVAHGWPVTVPPWVPLAGAGSTIALGVLAGLYPAVRAAGVPPTAALGG